MYLYTMKDGKVNYLGCFNWVHLQLWIHRKDVSVWKAAIFLSHPVVFIVYSSRENFDLIVKHLVLVFNDVFVGSKHASIVGVDRYFRAPIFIVRIR